MRQIKLSPFYLCVILYTLSNVTYALTAIASRGMLIEFYYYNVDSGLMLQALLFQSISLLLIIIVYEVYKRKSKFKIVELNGYGDLAGWILLLYQTLYILLAIFFGVGVVGREDVGIGGIILSLVSFFSADAIFFIVGSQLKSNKMFRINLGIYLISSLVRGWLGGFLIAFFIYLCRKRYLAISIKSLFVYIFGAVFIFLLSPVLIDLKFAIRNEVKLDLDFTNYSEKIEFATDYLLSRFQHVGHVYLILGKEDYYYQAYKDSQIRSFFLEGNVQYSIYNKLIGLQDVPFSEFLVRDEFGGSWNTNTGLAGWFLILKEGILFFILYWASLIFITYKLIYKYATKQLFLVISVFMLVYLYHGWLSAFFNLIFLAWFLVVIRKIRI